MAWRHGGREPGRVCVCECVYFPHSFLCVHVPPQSVHVSGPVLPDLPPEAPSLHTGAILRPVFVDPFAPGSEARLRKLDSHPVSKTVEGRAADPAQADDFKREVATLYDQVRAMVWLVLWCAMRDGLVSVSVQCW